MVKEFVVMHSLELQTLCAEIDQQTNLHFIRFEVIYSLGKVNILQLDDGFEFDHNQIFNEEVHSACADFLSAIKDGHFLLAFKSKIVIRKFNFQRTLVDDFLKAIAQSGVDFHGGGNNAASQILMLHTLISLITMIAS
jgi:hypothetical protein